MKLISWGCCAQSIKLACAQGHLFNEDVLHQNLRSCITLAMRSPISRCACRWIRCHDVGPVYIVTRNKVQDMFHKVSGELMLLLGINFIHMATGLAFLPFPQPNTLLAEK